MLAPILAAIIIILLIIYAAYPLLSNRDFSGWANIALTALILFTVIVTLFVILGHRKGQRITFRSIPSMALKQAPEDRNEPLIEEEPSNKEAQKQEEENATAQNTTQEQKAQEEHEMTDEEALLAIAKEYLEAEEAFKAKGDKDYQQKAAQQIIDRYDFTRDDWQTFLEDAAKYDLFNKAKEEMK